MAVRTAIVGTGPLWRRRVLIAWGKRRLVDPKTGEVPQEKHQVTSQEIEDWLQAASDRPLEEVARTAQHYKGIYPFRVRLLLWHLRWLRHLVRREVTDESDQD